MCKNIIVSSDISSLSIENVNKDNYSKPGVWALYGHTGNGQCKCLEVAKTIDIYSEIKSAIYILTTPDSNTCKECSLIPNNLYSARTRFEYSTKFNIHKCKECSHTSDLRIKSWKRNPRYIDKYKDMLSKGYVYFKFVCVDISEDMQDNRKRKAVEKQYAKTNTALYWYG